MGVSSKQQQHIAAAPPPLVHALSGAVGAVIAMALLYPLDQVRAILQVGIIGVLCACLTAVKKKLFCELCPEMHVDNHSSYNRALQIDPWGALTLYAVVVVPSPDLAPDSLFRAEYE